MNWISIPLEVGVPVGLFYAWAVVSLAVAFRLLGFPDLTVEGSFPLGACVFASAWKEGFPWEVAAVVGILAGAAAGAFTAFIHIRFRLNKFLCGIITVAVSYSLALRVMGAPNIGLLQARDIAYWGHRMLPGWPWAGQFLVLSVLTVAGASMLYVVFHSIFGMRLRTAGTSPTYARSLGLNVGAYTVIGLALTNGLAGLSGVLVAVNQGSADVGMGQGLLIFALAAMTIGERILPIRGLVTYHLFVILAAVVGSVAFEAIAVTAIHFGLAATDVKLITAMIVLAVVAFGWWKDEDQLVEDLN